MVELRRDLGHVRRGVVGGRSVDRNTAPIKARDPSYPVEDWTLANFEVSKQTALSINGGEEEALSQGRGLPPKKRRGMLAEHRAWCWSPIEYKGEKEIHLPTYN